MHDISEDVRGESSESEEEEFTEHAFSLPPREIHTRSPHYDGACAAGTVCDRIQSATNGNACFVHVIHASAAIDSSPRRTPFAAAEKLFDRQLSKEVELCGISRKQRGVRRRQGTRSREPALPYQLC